MQQYSPEPHYRESWGNFPPAIANDVMGTLRFDAKDVEAPEYNGGKRAGNMEDAVALIQRKLFKNTIKKLKQFLQRENIDLDSLVIVPVDAVEGAGKNKIPLAIAKVISEELGGVVIDNEIKQSNKVSRTGQGINHRLAFMPTFQGGVAPKKYLIVDDTLRVGGTIANLRGHINKHGGKTIGVFVMQSDEQSLTLQPSQKTYNKLYNKHQKEKVDEFCIKEFGFDSTCLTRGEAGNIAASTSLDEMGRRISDAREHGRRNGFEITRTREEAGQYSTKIERRTTEIERRATEIERSSTEIERIREKRSKTAHSKRDRGVERRGANLLATVIDSDKKNLESELEVLKKIKETKNIGIILSAEKANLKNDLKHYANSFEMVNNIKAGIDAINIAQQDFQTVQNPEAYRVVKSTMSCKDILGGLPLDGFRKFITGHQTRLSNLLKTHISVKEKAIIRQRKENMKIAKNIYMDLQRKALGLPLKKEEKGLER